MKKYRQKTVIIEAEKWNKVDIDSDDPTGYYLGVIPCEELTFYGTEKKECPHCGELSKLHGWIKTIQGWHLVCPGDIIIKEPTGQCFCFYPCKPSVFEKMYGLVETENGH